VKAIRLLATTAVLMTAARVGATGGQSPAGVPACEVYKISGPTIIAFFPYEGCDKQPHCEDALDDFQFYLRRMHEQFNEPAIRIHECYRQPFEIEVRGKKRKFTDTSVAYYLIVPDKEPRVELGVVTDADLVRLMNEYFGADVVDKAVARPQNDLPVEWSSLLTEFRAHDAPAKAYVTSKAAEATDPRSRALAAALLSEWDLSVHSERLQQPLRIHAPKLERDERQRHTEVFDVNVEVGEDGRVLAARFSRPPAQAELGREVLRIVQASLFRPAFRAGRFVRAKVTLESIVHVK
jgi:hypothetical protein